MIAGEGKQIPVEVEQVGEGGDDAGGAGDDVGGDRGKGVEIEAESSEATHRHTIYTRHHPAPGGGGTSGNPHGQEFEHIQTGSWDTHNPTCDNMPHVPRWKLAQGSRMNDLDNCHDFYSLSLPAAEMLFQKRRPRFDLLDDHVRAGETLEFENEKRVFAEEREKFNTEKKGLLWRVADAEQKLAQEKQVNLQKQKVWEIACERTNAEMQSQRDAIVRLSREKEKISEEANRARVASERREEEYVQRISKLEEFGEKKVVECKAAELLSEEISADCRWLLSRAVPLIADRIVNSPKLANYMFELGQAGYNSGRKDGYSEGRAAAANNEKDYHFEFYKENCGAKCAAFEKLSRKPDGVALLKKALGDEGRAARGAGTSHPE
ncbi:hypothetical protein Hanom_Chr14g01252531 [Helianthus anomalus]